MPPGNNAVCRRDSYLQCFRGALKSDRCHLDMLVVGMVTNYLLKSTSVKTSFTCVLSISMCFLKLQCVEVLGHENLKNPKPYV